MRCAEPAAHLPSAHCNPRIAPAAGADQLWGDVESCACADAGTAPGSSNRDETATTALGSQPPAAAEGSSQRLADVSLDPPDYSAYYSDGAASAVAAAGASAPSSRLTSLNGHKPDTSKVPSSSGGGGGGGGWVGAKIASAKSSLSARSTVALARDQAAANYVATEVRTSPPAASGSAPHAARRC